jgi:4-carboxymuconolactone decarboxylase
VVGEVSPLDALLCRIAAALAAGEDAALDRALARAASMDAAVAVEEVLIQSYLFLGYPAALNALARWREVAGNEPLGPSVEDWRGWERRGAEVCASVYGGQYERLRVNIRRLSPDMERWMVIEGYGKVLGRPGLALRARELAIVAQLTVIGASRQLYSHARGALNVGSSVEDVERALDIAFEFTSAERRREAREVWRTLRERGRPSLAEG